MPGERPTTERQISGDDIITEILRNADAGQFRMRKTVVLPSVFHVYLHPRDFDLIRPVLNALRVEARTALREKAEAWNRKAQPSRMGKLLGLQSSEAVIEYKILDPEYTIEFYPDAEQSLASGDLEIRSELASAPPPEFDGAMTRHITRKQGAVSYSESGAAAVREPSAVDAAKPAPAAAAEDPDATFALSRPDATAGAAIYAWLRYTDEGKAHEFPVTKSEIAIGRGGKSVWVDVRLNAPPDISREHCRIRRDDAGRFFISDLSQFGTSVDGRKIPAGSGVGLGTELPAKATVSLADVVVLEWEMA